MRTDAAYEPWDGYEDEDDEEALIRRLELKVDESRERYDRAYAQAVCAAVASHEQLKQQRGDDRQRPATAGGAEDGLAATVGSVHAGHGEPSAGRGAPQVAHDDAERLCTPSWFHVAGRTRSVAVLGFTRRRTLLRRRAPIRWPVWSAAP